MKHYVMAFFILFSALSSQWVGAMTFQNPHQHQVEVMTIDMTELQSQQGVMPSHDGCPSMKGAAKVVEQVVSSSCPNCGDNCQCDSNVCHSSSFSLATLSANGFNLQVLTDASVITIQSHLPIAPVSLEIRPPKSV
ncbi:MAG: hypothetical protein ISEC1_P0463 [Thiomicrorhabdus sp.]|nr:MAG: hypothetical protein ISEC1_P0463 [Thiomicrorhabdus sp.]